MRNLKKFLALVMAMVMALSLMVTANAATTNVTYTDSASVTPEFAEAVDVLSGMGVFHGDEDGFRPGSTITRAEVSAVVYRLATGDVNDTRSGLYATYQSFSDVPMDAWYAGYVGYLWNAGFVKGTSADTFSPDENVTGYEVLAMILRAIGYDKNHEFEGAEWIVNVASLATQLGILRDVKTTHFADILHLGARRDVVASLLFNTAAYVPEVKYTALTGYNQFQDAIGNRGYNPSLGYRLFGLVANHGIVVGNQSTGEKYTKIGFKWYDETHPAEKVGDYVYIGRSTTGTFAMKPDYDAYIYADKNKDEAGGVETDNKTMSFIWDTDLRLFGHQVKVWYDYRNTINSNDNYILNTYAAYDEATKTQVVKAGLNADITSTAKKDDGKAINEDVGYMADKAGFEVNTTDGAYYNYAFGPTIESNRDIRSSDAHSANFESPILENNSDTVAPYYLLISNSTEKENSLDMIISLDLTVTQISQQNDVSKPLSIGLNVGDDNEGGAIYFGGDNGTSERLDLPNYVDFGTRLNIAQKNLVPYMANNKLTDSSKTLGDQVVAIEITGTTDKRLGSNATATNYEGNAKQVLHDGDTSNYYYQTIKLTRQISGTVVKVDVNSHEVWFSDGTKLERSWLADTVSNNRLTSLGTDNETNIDKNVQRAKEPDAFGDYTFTLDDEGKYIFWTTEKTDTTFVYGTYLDYNTVTASSTFVYPLVNVRLDGKTSVDNVTKVWDKWNGHGTQLIDASDNTKGVDLNSQTYDEISLPKRDRYADRMGAQVYNGQYIGYTLNDKGELKAVLSENNATNAVKQGNLIYFGDPDIGDRDGSIEIGSTDVKIGAVSAGTDENNSNTGLYLTENTQFYLVSGAGTDNLKVDAYKGLSGLLGSNSKVIIHGEKRVGDTADAKDAKASSYWPLKAGENGERNIPNYEMIYWTQSPFHYAQDYATTAFQADVVILPLEAVEFVGGVDSSLYFVGNTKSTLYDADRDATQFTMYDRNGNEVSRWLEGKADDTATAKNSADVLADMNQADYNNVFVNLVATSDKAKDGNPIYKLATVSSPGSKLIGQYLKSWDVKAGSFSIADKNSDDDAATPADYKYKATTYTDQLATIGTSRTKIWNVSGAKVINLNTDDYPGVTSLTTLNAASSLESNDGIDVSCFLSSDNDKQASVIFVNYED